MALATYRSPAIKNLTIGEILKNNIEIPFKTDVLDEKIDKKDYFITNYFAHILHGKAPTCTVVETNCPLCGEYLDVLTHVHAAKHSLTKSELKELIDVKILA